MSDTVAWEQVAGLSVMAIIPPVIVAMVFQRYIIRGLTFGAVKG
jgi:multiple sugar transport system permease protein